MIQVPTLKSDAFKKKKTFIRRDRSCFLFTRNLERNFSKIERNNDTRRITRDARVISE